MAASLDQDIEDIRTLLKEREQASGDLAAALKRARRRLPRRVYKQGMKLADALPMLEHPKLRPTVDEKPLRGAAREVKAHLQKIDLADRRKGFWLGVLGSAAFSLLVVLILLVVVLRWRGLI
ncbi:MULTISPECIES: hypothetical protein [unclassified Leisingera]|uniref:hypothetical protein n=1 Tax=unclassified Leisingera TaxID=2614906 RepID=UPI001010BD26|nr:MULTISPECIES: hypothetical protein [unclassified Leisingera]MBQ4825029.1 hypothetical protein [Leisingera sp. HS039]MCF6433628.1 hypothetical protein [Leisingera sp. MMG026]QAX29321.1 hypothetical protein ETW24_08110 [Leisingera sp. NJS204]QBR36091.1 hypothetical protein ETW23_08000 [Leisingera sp. NJS201]